MPAVKERSRHTMMEQQSSQHEAVSGASEPPADPWRNEVQDRLARYKRRRGRRIEGAFTMRFPFPADEVEEPAIATEVAAAAVEPGPDFLQAIPPIEPVLKDAQAGALPESPAMEMVAEPVPPATEELPESTNLILEETPALAEEAVPFVDTVSRPRPKRKVIAFPKQLSVAHEAAYRLADPVTAEVPRILDVPEELEATPFLDGLQLDLPKAEVAADPEHVELPFRAVRIPQRVAAGIVDLAIVGIGLALFAAIAIKILGRPPLSKPLIFGMVAAAVVLWSAYQYLFVVHAGRTMGMLAARIRLRTFNGRAPRLQQRRNRVLGFYLSALSLGMGLMWALIDVDALCWHDRLSQTCLANRESPAPSILPADNAVT